MKDNTKERFLRKLDLEQKVKRGLPGEDEPPLPEPVEPIHAGPHVGRNDLCPCGSGLKYKKCCALACEVDSEA